MPDLVNQDKQALDWIVANPDDPRVSAAKFKLGVKEDHVQAWKFATENPDDGRSNIAKNKVFEHVANTRPAVDEQGVTGLDRFLIKNFVDNEPSIQTKYLERKGFDTRIVDGEVQMKRPEETNYKKIEPDGFDLWDVTDVVGDVLEGAADAFATGVKLIGLGSAPVTAGASIPATMGIGGAIATGLETGRQFLGKRLGLRDEINKSKITQAGLTGLIAPGVAKLAGLGFKGIGKGLRKVTGLDKVVLRPNVAEIKASAKKLGVKPTLGMLVDDRTIQQIEEGLRQKGGTLSGMMLRRQMKKNYIASVDVAESLFKGRSTGAESDVLNMARKELVEDYAEILRPSVAIYDKWEDVFKNVEIKPNIKQIQNKITKQISQTADLDARRSLALVRDEMLPNIKTLENLKEIRGVIREDMAGSLNPRLKGFFGDIHRSLTLERGNALKRAGRIWEAAHPGSGSKELADAAIEEIGIADKMYRAAANDLQQTVFAGGKPISGGLRGALNNYIEKNPGTKALNKIMDSSNPEKMHQLKRVFPNAFETMREAKIAQAYKTMDLSKEGITAIKAVKAIDKLDGASAHLLFGEGGVDKMNALKTVLRATGDRGLLGPSGTPEGAFWNMISIVQQAKSFGLARRLKATEKILLEKDIFSRLSRFLASPKAVAASVIGGRQQLGGQEDDTQFGLQLPTQALPQGLQLPQGAR